MASKSLTAVTSFVSVMKEKTVLVLKLNVKGCQRVGLPIAIIVACFLTVGLLVAAAATDQMIRVSAKDNSTGDDAGELHFSLFRGAHSILPHRNIEGRGRDTQDYLIYNVYKREDIVGIYATTIATGLTVILCIVTAVLAFVNSFQVRINWFYGPPMLYNCTLFTALMAMITVGMISDYYLWNIDAEKKDIMRASLELSELEYLVDFYTTKTSFQYSFWLLIGGAIIPLLSFLLSWRLAVLQPCSYNAGVEKSFSAFEMSEQQSSVFQESATQRHVYY